MRNFDISFLGFIVGTGHVTSDTCDRIVEQLVWGFALNQKSPNECRRDFFVTATAGTGLKRKSEKIMGDLSNGWLNSSPLSALVKAQCIDQLAWQRISYSGMFALLFGTPAVVQFSLGLPWWCYPFIFALLCFPLFAGFMMAFNRVCVNELDAKYPTVVSRFVKFNDPSLAAKYSQRKIPMLVLYEAYADRKLDFKCDVLEALENRHHFATFELTFHHLKFLLCNFFPELMFHSKAQDCEQVRDHYDRGNDFYEAFLGSLMIYTSGISNDTTETLEELQMNKLKGVCEKCQLKEGEHHLDIGCGWGTLVNYAAERHGTQSTGVTLSRNQVDWAEGVSTEKNLGDKVNFWCQDYRDIPQTKFDKITCLEMAEHVGVRKFQGFLTQVRDMLEDEGLFFLQIAGLRRTWQWEDLIWGLFMAKYIFPGADASCPLGWVVTQLEMAGFEVKSTETIGIHYSLTIKRWYENWMRAETQIQMEKYGRISRIWNIFLAWSTIIARQGSSTCTQIVCHKNLNNFDRTKLFKIKKN